MNPIHAQCELLPYFSIGLVHLLLFLILVLLDLMWALGNKMIGASTIIACPLLLVWKLPLY